MIEAGEPEEPEPVPRCTRASWTVSIATALTIALGVVLVALAAGWISAEVAVDRASHYRKIERVQRDADEAEQRAQLEESRRSSCVLADAVPTPRPAAVEQLRGQLRCSTTAPPPGR